jgi:hypothetical protein
MDRYIGLDVHSTSTTVAVIGPSGPTSVDRCGGDEPPSADREAEAGAGDKASLPRGGDGGGVAGGSAEAARGRARGCVLTSVPTEGR